MPGETKLERGSGQEKVKKHSTWKASSTMRWKLAIENGRATGRT